MWIAKKSPKKTVGCWSQMITNLPILQMAHTLASKSVGTGVLVQQHGEADVVVGNTQFRDFLVHLFVISVLWVHFKQADSWSAGYDLGIEQLNFAEFSMACRTFTTAQAREAITEQSLKADFDMLDVDKSGSIEFSEVS